MLRPPSSLDIYCAPSQAEKPSSRGFQYYPSQRLGRPIDPSRNAEELEILLLEQRHRMADPLRKDRLEVGAERRVRVPAREVRLRRVRDRRARVPEHRRPLLDFLEEVLREECGVTRYWRGSI